MYSVFIFAILFSFAILALVEAKHSNPTIAVCIAGSARSMPNTTFQIPEKISVNLIKPLNVREHLIFAPFLSIITFWRRGDDHSFSYFVFDA